MSPDKSSRRKRIHKAAQAALLALSFLATSSAHAANDWVNFATVSMTNATTPKLTNGYGCYTDGKDVLCDSKTSAVTFGTSGLIDNGGMTVAGSISASAVSATYISGTVIQVNTSSMPCSTGLAGTIRYNSGNIEYCNGSTWGQLANGSGGTLSGGSATAIAFWSGPSSLTYESATTSGLYWDATNKRLGVGTNAPSAALTISNSSVSGVQIKAYGGGAQRLTAYVSNGIPYIYGFDDTGNNNTDFGIGGYGVNSAGVYIKANTSTGIATTGINTQSPTATLQVSGTFTVSNSAQTTTPSLLVASGGNVGMGVSSPAYRLEVKQATGGILPGINIVTDTTPRASMGFGLDAGTTTGWIIGQSKDQMQKDFYVYDVAKGVFRMVFDTSGSIGIGTASPGSSLTVVGGEIQTGTSGGACTTATNGGAIRYSAGTLYYCNGSNTWTTISGGGAGFTGGGSATAIAFWNGTNSLTYESATTSGLYWDHTNGRLGVGMNAPQRTFHLVGPQGAVPVFPSGLGAKDIAVIENNDNANLALVVSASSNAAVKFYKSGGASYSGYLLYDNPTDSLRFATNGTEQARFNSLGALGIGTQSPTATLQVSGTMTVSTTGQNTASAASLLVDSRGVSVSSIVHINGSAFSPIGAGGNAILSGTTAVSTSSAGSITLYTAASQRMLIGSNGWVGIGAQAAPIAPLDILMPSGVNSTVMVRRSANSDQATFASVPSGVLSGSNPAWFSGLYNNNAGWYLSTWDGAATNTRLYVDSSGNVAVGTNNPAVTNPGIVLGPTGFITIGTSSGATNGWGFINFQRNSVGMGGITYNGTGVSYNQTSDRRMKENITDTREGLQQLMAIGVKDFSFKADPSHTIVNGFIAQDLSKVYPEAVTTNGDNGEVPLKDTKHIWQVDYGRVTPLIVKAVQDLKHLFDSDKAETDAKLEAANDNIQTLGKQVEALREEIRELKQQRR